MGVDHELGVDSPAQSLTSEKPMATLPGFKPKGYIIKANTTAAAALGAVRPHPIIFAENSVPS